MYKLSILVYYYILFQLFLPPPANDFDLEDENNLLLPFDSYENLHDPYSKGYVRNKHILDHLQHRGYITESQKVTCTLKDINKYRIYQRRILAAEVQKKLRDEVIIFLFYQFRICFSVYRPCLTNIRAVQNLWSYELRLTFIFSFLRLPSRLSSLFKTMQRVSHHFNGVSPRRWSQEELAPIF